MIEYAKNAQRFPRVCNFIGNPAEDCHPFKVADECGKIIKTRFSEIVKKIHEKNEKNSTHFLNGLLNNYDNG